MRKHLLFVVCCIAIACQRNETTSTKKGVHVTTKTIPGDARNARVNDVIQPVPVFIDRAALGDKVGPDGNVTQEAVRVPTGQPMYLTLYLHDSPVGLHTRAVWTDRATKKVVYQEQRDMKGAKVATFSLDTKKLAPGRYHVEGYWGGNVAADKEFEIVGKGGKGKK